MAKFYITTPIYYINDVPHVGHAYTAVVADVLARWHRLKGDDTFFLTGLDENSAKTIEAAKKQGAKDIQAYADFMAKKWLRAWKLLSISNDDFIRTTEERHRKNVTNFFKKIHERGDIYKGVYEGLYCEGCEAYLTEADLVDGKCVLHKTKPKHIKEENYFFKLSKYADQILKHIEANPEFIQPEGRRNEVISFIKQGLRDISISRPGLEWGIKLPIDDKQTIWVWFDALINYLAPKDRWPADAHLIAKDILRFHCIIWPGMLLSAGYKLPKRIFAHGFLTANGQKISKSLGNVIDPVYLAEKYSADVLRYYLVREISFGQDGDFSEKSLRIRLNDELADVLGNFAHRVLTFTYDRFDGKVPNGELDKKLESELVKRIDEIEELLEELKVTQALEKIISIAKLGNEYFQSCKPWEAVKTDPQKAADCLFNCVNLVKVLCIALYPFMPSTCETLAKQLNIKIESWEQTKKVDIKHGHAIQKPTVLFKKTQTNNPGKEGQISIEDFNKLEIRIAKVVKAERIPNTKKLLKLEVDIAGKLRTLVAGVAGHYTPEELIDKHVVVLVNIEPTKLMGVTSEGMILAAIDDDKISLLTVDRPVKHGSKVG
jgi:methionyl-tRNA synthetase